MMTLKNLIHLSAKEIRSIHDSILEDFSGLKGSRPDLSVDALVGRIHSNLAYQPFHSIEEVAALYAEVIAKGHVFSDGNKRTALVSMLTFLDLNNYKLLVADQDALADQIVELADGKINYRQFSIWLKSRVFLN